MVTSEEFEAIKASHHERLAASLDPADREFINLMRTATFAQGVTMPSGGRYVTSEEFEALKASTPARLFEHHPEPTFKVGDRVIRSDGLGRNHGTVKIVERGHAHGLVGVHWDGTAPGRTTVLSSRYLVAESAKAQAEAKAQAKARAEAKAQAEALLKLAKPPAWDPLGAAPFAWHLPEPGPPPRTRRQRMFNAQSLFRVLAYWFFALAILQLIIGHDFYAALDFGATLLWAYLSTQDMPARRGRHR